MPWLIVLLATSSPDASNPLVSYGLLGVILAAFVYLILTGKLVSGKEFDRVVQEKEALQRAAPEAVSALVTSTEATKEASKVMRDVLVALQVMSRQSGGP